VTVCIVLGQFIATALNREYAEQVAYLEWREEQEMSAAVSGERKAR
jgi:hypothetical protein